MRQPETGLQPNQKAIRRSNSSLRETKI